MRGLQNDLSLESQPDLISATAEQALAFNQPEWGPDLTNVFCYILFS